MSHALRPLQLLRMQREVPPSRNCIKFEFGVLCMRFKKTDHDIEYLLQESRNADAEFAQGRLGGWMGSLWQTREAMDIPAKKVDWEP